MVPKRAFLVSGTFFLALLLYIDRVCISTAKEPITAALDLTDKQFGWIMSAFALGYALFQTPSGALADKLGPRSVLTSIVVLWSLFTGLTAVAWNYVSMLVVRFLFGASEAGAYPSIARAFYSWMPMNERGLATGINFAGGRLGAMFAMPLIATLITTMGWKQTFATLMVVGFIWSVAWYLWFRNLPEEHSSISTAEREYILANRQESSGSATKLPFSTMMASGNMWLAMTQYFCSNFTFFFCLTWLFPYLKKTYELTTIEAGWYSAAPFFAGAVGNIFAGALIDWIYRKGKWKVSRQLPAMIGFALAALGLLLSLRMDSAGSAVFWFSIAIFGADMTLAPSWAFSTDIGRNNAGAVSGTMNMAGNIGSFVTALAFPYLLAWTGTPTVFFYVAAGLNALAILLWAAVKPDQPLEATAEGAAVA